jgi:hypothetical protein
MAIVCALPIPSLRWIGNGNALRNWLEAGDLSFI